MQSNYSYPNAIVGQLGTYATRDLISQENPIRAQVTNFEYNGITTDGSYSMSVVGDDGSSATSTPFVASSSTAAQIAAGVAAGMLSDPVFAGLVSSATVITTDNLALAFEQPGVVYTSTASGPATPTQSNTTTAGYTEVSLGVILQASAGSFTTTYSDASLALGVTVCNPSAVSGLDGGADVYDGPAMMLLCRRGEVMVAVAVGITVAVGEKVYFNGSAKTWSNVTTGSHVLVEGAQWRTAGTGIQRAFVNLPSET